MAKYIMKFTKLNNIKFISHLDLVKVFERGFRRSDIKLAYSQGFNPHPKMSIAHPLSLGYSSVGEYIEVETIKEFPAEHLSQTMNNSLPDGLEILEVMKIEGKIDAIASIVRFAAYEVTVPVSGDWNSEEFKSKFELFLKQDQILIEKKAKKGRKRIMKEVDVKPLIHEVDFVKMNDQEILIETVLKTGSEGNLNPEKMLKAFMVFSEFEIDIAHVKYHRTELMFEELNTVDTTNKLW